MSPEETKQEAENLLQLFSLNSSSAAFTKAAALFAVKREIELLEYICKEKFIVHFNLERFNKIISDKKLILEELKKII